MRDSQLHQIVQASKVVSSKFPVALVVARGAARKWWKPWSTYKDLFAIVTPDQVLRFTGNSYPTLTGRTGLWFQPFTVQAGIHLVTFGDDPHRKPSPVIRQAEKITAVTRRHTVTDWLQFAIHAGPQSVGCFTISPRQFTDFLTALELLAILHKNAIGYSDAGLYAPSKFSKRPLVPMLVLDPPSYS